MSKYDIIHDHEGCLWTVFKEEEQSDEVKYIMESKCIVCKIKIYQAYTVTEHWDNRIYTRETLLEWIKL